MNTNLSKIKYSKSCFIIILKNYSYIRFNIKCHLMKRLKQILEKSAFGVCSYLGEKMGIATARVRVYFIYLSFAALGSPIIFYLFIAFWLNVKAYIKQKRRTLSE